MTTKKIIINDETKHKIKKIVKAAIPCVIGGAIAATIGVIFYKKGMNAGANTYENNLLNALKDPDYFVLSSVDKDAAKNGILWITGNVMKSEDDIVSFMSKHYFNGNPEPEVMDNIIKSAKKILSDYHVN